MIAEADRRAAADLDQKVHKGEALARLLAEREGLQYKPPSVRAWMRGDAMPPADVLLAVAQRLDGVELTFDLTVDQSEPDNSEIHLVWDAVEVDDCPPDTVRHGRSASRRRNSIVVAACSTWRSVPYFSPVPASLSAARLGWPPASVRDFTTLRVTYPSSPCIGRRRRMSSWSRPESAAPDR